MITLALDGRPLVVAGTDTGVGKTFVACCLLAVLRARGVRVRAMKPVESGCAATVNADEDGSRLAHAAGQTEPGSSLVRLAAPLAPPDAADLEGARLDYGAWLSTARRLASACELLVVEGAGGLLSPLTWERTVLDLAVDTHARALLVAADRLGSINHTRLCALALAQRGVPLAGIVLSAPREPDGATGRNAAALARVLPGIPLASLARCASLAEGMDACTAVLDVARP